MIALPHKDYPAECPAAGKDSADFTQPASDSVPAVSVPAKLLEFSYDGLSRRIRKKVQEKPAGSSTWSIVKWEAYVYDGWNMVMAVNLNPTAGGSFGKAQSLVASYVWGPDIGSPATARSDWQRAGGVGGLLMAVYPVAASGSIPTFAQWMTSEGYNPLPQEGSNEWEDALWNYQSIWGSNVNVHVPVMDHMGNVLGVTRLAATPGSGGTATSEYVYDYDASGREIRSSSLVANGNPDSFPFHYSTKFTDGETGLNYYGYRYLDAQRGRWINRDPIGEDGGVNLYGMVGNSPTGQVDRLGMDDVRVNGTDVYYQEEGFLGVDNGNSQSIGKLDSSTGIVEFNQPLRNYLGGVDSETLTNLEDIGGEDSIADFLTALRKLTSHGTSCVKISCGELKDLLDKIKGGEEALERALSGYYNNLSAMQKGEGVGVAGIAGSGVTSGGSAVLSPAQSNFVDTFEKSKSFNSQPGAKVHSSPLQFSKWAGEALSRNHEEQKLVEREMKARGCPP